MMVNPALSALNGLALFGYLTEIFLLHVVNIQVFVTIFLVPVSYRISFRWFKIAVC